MFVYLLVSAILVVSLVECPITKTLEVAVAASHNHGLAVLALVPIGQDRGTG